MKILENYLFKQKLFILTKLPIRNIFGDMVKLKSKLARISSPSGNILVLHKEGGTNTLREKILMSSENSGIDSITQDY